MSLIGRRPIKIEAGVKVTVGPTEVLVSGPKGSLTVAKPAQIGVREENGWLKCIVKDASARNLKEKYGLVRSLLQNAVLGVSQGFEKRLELVGMGYRVVKEGEHLKLSLGFSHPVIFEAPTGIVLEVPDQTTIVVKGSDYHLVGQAAANIRNLKKPEPYKGKGIRYVGEIIRRKAGKAGKAVTAT